MVDSGRNIRGSSGLISPSAQGQIQQVASTVSSFALNMEMETPQHLWTTCSTVSKHGHGEIFFFIKWDFPYFSLCLCLLITSHSKRLAKMLYNRQSPLTQPIFFLWRKFMGDFSAGIAVAVSRFLQGGLVKWYCLFWQKTYSGRKFSVVWVENVQLYYHLQRVSSWASSKSYFSLNQNLRQVRFQGRCFQ